MAVAAGNPLLLRHSGREVSGDDVIDFLREGLASYKKPRHVVFVEEIPRNPGLKVLKKEAAEVAIKQLELDVPAGG